MLCRLSPTAGRTLAKTAVSRRAPFQKFYSIQNAGAEDWDVVIVGGGPNGLALASALVSSQPVRETLRIALIEAGDLGKVQQWSLAPDSFSNRVSSITNSSKAFLEEIGGWEHVDESRITPVEQMQVWDGVSDSRITFSADEASGRSGALDQMAHMTENLNLQRALLHKLRTWQQVKIIDKVKVSQIIREERQGGGWPLVHTSDGRVMRTRLLVGADGFNSPVRAYSGIQSFGWAYDTKAIVATLRHAPRVMSAQLPNTTAYQRFLPTGPIAFLPLSSTVSSLVWSTTPTLATTLQACDPAILTMMVNAAFRLPEVSMRYLNNVLLESQAGPNNQSVLAPNTLFAEINWRELSHNIEPHSAYSSIGKVQDMGIPPADSDALPPLVTSMQPGSIASFPIRYSHADAYIGEGSGGRTVLIGDAAHTVHPLAGQGLNMGLGDAEALAACINKAVTLGNDIGSHTALQPYARARYFENHKLLSATDKLHKLYSSTLEPIIWARSVGLEVINELDSVKTAFMMSAGARSTLHGSASGPNSGVSGWSTAAKGVEVVAGGVDAAKVIGNTLGRVAVNSLNSLLSPHTPR